MRPYYPTNTSLQQQQPSSQYGAPQHSAHPITPSAVAALAMSSFTRSAASTFTQPLQGLAGPSTNAWGYSLSSTYVPPPNERPVIPNNYQHPSQHGPMQRPHRTRQVNSFSPMPSESPVQSKKRRREEEPPTPIPGTGILLDTPGAIAAWIAERKARWPSAKRIEEKNTANKTASDRGEINGSTSRRPLLSTDRSAEHNRRPPLQDRRPHHGQPRGRERRNLASRQLHTAGQPPTVRITNRDRNTAAAGLCTSESRPTVHGTRPRSLTPYSDSSSGSETSNSDVDPARDAVSSKVEAGTATESGALSTRPFAVLRPTRIARRRTTPHRQPTTVTEDLMRALLATEIRATVSRLSQAIRFLVDNDFLSGVEPEIGEASAVEPVTLLPDTENSQKDTKEQRW